MNTTEAEKVKQIKSSLAPIRKLLEDPEITDISIFHYNKIFAKYRGKGFVKTNCSWTDQQALNTVAQQISRFVNRPLDGSKLKCLCDARLPGRFRVNITVAPVYIDGVHMSIRKFPEVAFNVSDFVNKFKTLDDNGAKLLDILIQSKNNIIISGGTSTGKTSLLNILCQFIPDDVIIATIEDPYEIALFNKAMWIRLEVQKKLHDDQEDISFKKLIINALRQTPKWFGIGEVRGDEIFDLIRALNTGHNGISTVHANSPDDAMFALETLYMPFNSNILSIRQILTRTVKIIIHIERLGDERLVIDNISEVLPLKNGEFNLKTLYKFNLRGYDNNNKSLGDFEIVNKPSFYNKLLINRINTFDLWRNNEEKKAG